MTEHLLEIRFDQSANDDEEWIRGVLFLTGSSGDFVSGEGADCCITAFFEDSHSRTEARRALSEIERIRLEDVDREETDWLLNYQQSLQAFEVGSKFLVTPDPSLITSSARIVLVVPQERAFGTGSHESTALCLEMLEWSELVGTNCLDIGTGSGILAMAMAALGARRTFAFDNDIETFGVVAKNLRRNEIQPGKILQFFADPAAMKPGRFDVITMNILPDVIVERMGDVSVLLAPRGRIIFSGVLVERSGEVRSAATAHGLSATRESSAGDWWCGLFARSSS